MNPWRICALAVASVAAAHLARAQPAIALIPYASGLSSPVGLAAPPDGTGRLFIVQQGGRIAVHNGTQVLPTPFLDLTPLVLSGGEQGLLGLAFHPAYPATPYFFVNYTCRSGSADCPGGGDTIIARYSVSTTNPNVADPASRRVLLVIDQPFANHNAGDLKFGPDGYLWIPMGDGGSANDPNCFAQRDDSLLGKILRIDVNQNVNNPPFYGIPPDNPYIGPGDPRDEVYARGLRNPFRFSFDRQTGDLFIGDVGQSAREEVDFTAVGTGAADNYGWKIMEGTLCTGNTGGCPGGVPACNSPLFTVPILEYDHGLGDCAIIGGFRYRGMQVPTIAGLYLYSDNCTGRIRAGTESPPGTWTASQLLDTPYNVSSFGEDQAGELYVTALNNGVVYRIVSGGPTAVSVNDVTVTEGNVGAVNAVFTVSLSAAVAQTVTAQYATADGTAVAGADYTASGGTVTFPPGAVSRTVSVPVLGDVLDEDDETFSLNLSNPVGATIADGQGIGTIIDNDPLPFLFTGDCAVIEGNTGSTPCDFTVILAPVSGRTVSVGYATANGTATAGSDYTAAGGSLTFPAGTTQQGVSVGVLGDTITEPDETFFLNLSPPSNAILADGQGTGTIVDDDGASLSTLEVSHGTELRADFAGGTADLYRISQRPLSSYEVVIDDASGEAVPGLLLERLAADGTTVAQTGVPVGTGSALSLRWENTVAATVNGEHIRLRSPACGTDCGADDVYRLRVYDTTFSLARFNNTGSQITVIVLQNPTNQLVSGHIHFWSVSGALLLSQPLTLAPHAALVLNSATLPVLQGHGGSVTLAHDAPYGALSGKTVALEPATGFSFDSPLEPKGR
jgi:glucose/sorbosone dehydrogenase/Calx-beta domain-containing protein